MEMRSGAYEVGFEAGKRGATADQNPYTDHPELDGVYVLTAHDSWEHGRQDGAQACPHCGGTGRRA